MLSRKAKYAIRALTCLARQRGAAPMLIRDISRQERIPQKFLEAILVELKAAGFLQSKPGKGGGYLLRRAPRFIRLVDIIRLIDGPLAPTPCVSQTAYAPCDDCISESHCALRTVMKDVRDAMAQILELATIEALATKQDFLESQSLPLDFNI